MDKDLTKLGLIYEKDNQNHTEGLIQKLMSTTGVRNRGIYSQ